MPVTPGHQSTKGAPVSRSARVRPSHLAVVPDDVTDPLLWRLALDVASAHQPENGRCRNLQCADQPGPCATLAKARRAMALARATSPAAAEEPAPVAQPVVARGRATVPAHDRRRFTGWFTRPTRAVTRRWNGPVPALPRRIPGAALAAA